LPLSHPVNHDIVKLHLDNGCDDILFSRRKDDVTVIAAVCKSSEDVWGIILLVT